MLYAVVVGRILRRRNGFAFNRNAFFADQGSDRSRKVAVIEPAHKRYRTATFAGAGPAIEKLSGDVDRETVLAAAMRTRTYKLAAASLQSEPPLDGDAADVDCLRRADVSVVDWRQRSHASLPASRR